MFKLPDPSGPLRSNFDAVERCGLYHRRPRKFVKSRPSKLPTPKETTLRMELAMLKADIARAPFLAAQIAKLSVELGRQPVDSL